ncbi:MAG: adenosine deaminase [Tissierellia bacterium]|nr:adenosine deaminase [Tissierellia bacterium]
MRELHLHLDGSLRPRSLWEMAKAQGIDLGIDNLDELEKKMVVPGDCQDLTQYLEKFALPLLVLQEKGSLERGVYELAQDLKDLGMDYGEVRFAPSLHTQKGLSQEEALKDALAGVKRAQEDLDFSVVLILCMMRGEGNETANLETLRLAEAYGGQGVGALDLAGAEGLYPTKDFADLLALAKKKGLRMTLHAGEAAGPESIWEALKYGPERIGHGVAAAQDPALMEKLKEKGILLEVCLSSNLQTRVVDDLADHPIRTLYDAGVRVCLNSDNMTVSNTNLVRERQLAKEALAFTDEDLERMDDYAREASFGKR